ncbi:hypothetical protein TNCT_604241 [Trichonephila clavata]|uniref:Uncharacterized protein n=1 Tax=Trichonephila clavata TaxID=2740835 RepID=A0A8X6KB74_TRICU|nr:hypothetical protein TNCT_246151 [Trichonephila clavata]GFR23773.1 hypothetical protein TNCT_604241 [Trichonephila clavata]
MEETSRKDRRGLRKRGNGRKEEANRAAGRKERNGGTPVLRASAPRPRDDLDPRRPSETRRIRTPGGTGCALSEFRVLFPMPPQLFRRGLSEASDFSIFH